MRLLQLTVLGDVTFTKDLIEGKDVIPPYAVLSHRWEENHDEEVTYEDVKTEEIQKRGYRKIQFCAEQARRDKLGYFWVDTCCIDKSNAAELSESINSMFRWYKCAAKCYVYLSDVSSGPSSEEEPPQSTWEQAFQASEWFRRGWTLQELIAPSIVEFYSSDAKRLGDKRSLSQTIHEVTGIPIRALEGAPLSEFSVEDQIFWSKSRTTSRPEDKAYSLIGILSISLVANYGEGAQNAFERLRSEIAMRSPLKVLEKLPAADGAAHDSHANEHDAQCLEGTRAEVLSEIAEWVRDPSSKAVYWLNGMAGTGKSTISRTIANKISEENNYKARLGATFFFKRGEGDRGKMSKFFTTITSQLVQKLPEIAVHVQAAIEAEPALVSKTMRTQFEALIVNPVSKISKDTSPCIFLFVIDALDECEREEDIRLLIKLLSSFSRATTVQLKFFLTSRPELPIRLGFNTVTGKYRDFILHEVAGPVIEHDLAVYLKHELELTRLSFNQDLPEERRLPANWPNPKDIGSLVQMAIPLFIFAATTCRFVADRKGGNPEKKLRRVLEFRSAQASKLVATYLPVLEQLTMDLTPEEQSETMLQFQQIVGPIVVLADPLGSRALSQLLNIATDEILDLLDFLHSVLQVPISPEQPIRLLHLSFRDFLMDPERQGNPFWINERKTHQQLAERCLQVLNSSLENDICHAKAAGRLASSISASEMRTHISPELQYACRFWTYHLRESSSSNSNTPIIWEFLSQHFLQWLEVLSWIGRFPESLGMVESLQSIMPKVCQAMNEFVADSVRFIQAMGTNIQNAPLQAYSSALVFSPTRSIVRNLYQKNTSRYVDLNPYMSLFWGENQRTLEGHTDSVNGVAFSPDGQQIASASDDGTVILWSAATGKKQRTLEGHRHWSAATGNRQRRLEGHTGSVRAVAFSPDGQQIASASNDQTVILWSAAPDGQQVASPSSDKTVTLWPAATGKKHRTLEGHRGWVHAVAFSPDGQQIASASSDKTVILWSTTTGEKQKTLEGHTDAVHAIAFSPDGQKIASASNDQTVILWSTATGKKQRRLKGHRDWVQAVAFSPDGQQIASTPGDRTVILWSATTGKKQRRLEGHTDWVHAVAFSPDGQQIASASSDKTVILWSAATGGKQKTLKGHKDSVHAVAFSPDGQQIASASSDKTVILWSVATGERRHVLQTGYVSDLRFNSAGTRILSSCGGWNVTSPDRNPLEEPLLSLSDNGDSSHCAISSDNCWIMKDGQHVLWLPVEYRPSVSTVFGKSIVLGCSSGRVLILRII